MKLHEGTQLEYARWNAPREHYDIGMEQVKSLTVSIEAGGPWLVIEYQNAIEIMRPLDDGVTVKILGKFKGEEQNATTNG